MIQKITKKPADARGKREQARRLDEHRLLHAASEFFGLDDARSHNAETFNPYYKRLGWTFSPCAPSRRLLRSALSDGAKRVSTGGHTLARYAVVDLDAHGLEAVPAWFPWAEKWEGRLDELFADTKSVAFQREAAARQRAWIASKVNEAVAMVVDAVGGSDWAHVHATRRGYHVVVPLREHVPVEMAAAIASRLAKLANEHLGEGCQAEGFPKLGPNGTGRTCSLPLIGPHTPVHTNRIGERRCTRRQALRELVSHRGSSAFRLYRKLRCGDRSKVVLEPDSRTNTGGKIGGVVGGSLGPGVGGCTENGKGGCGDCDACLGEKPCVHTHLLREKFAACVERLLLVGMMLGESYDALRKISFAGYVGLGYSRGEVLRVLEQYVRKRLHGASSTQSEKGVRRLLANVVGSIRHYDRGVAQGRLEIGLMESRQIDAYFKASLRGEDGVEAMSASWPPPREWKRSTRTPTA